MRRRQFGLGVTASIWAAGCGKNVPATNPQPSPQPSSSSGKPAAVLSVGAHTSATLRALLADNRLTDPVGVGGFSNHRSMALSALSWLGADDARLQAFASAQANSMEPLRSGAPLTSEDWRASIASPPALVGLIGYFEQRLAAEGRQRVLGAVLPELMPGLSGELFHGLIRTAYALAAEEDAELAQALAYFATVALPVRPLPPPAAGAASAEQLLRGAFTARGFRDGFTSSGSAALPAAAAQAGFDETVAALQVHSSTLHEIARAALALYLGSRDIVALHTVTATHALGVLLPYLGDSEQALRYHFQAVLGVGLTLSDRSLREPSAKSPPDWPTILATACASNDAHDIKLAYTCQQEATLHEPLAYRETAALRLGLK